MDIVKVKRMLGIGEPAGVGAVARRAPGGGAPAPEWRRDRAGLQRRGYANYQQYVEHQAAKLGHIDLREYEIRYHRTLIERLRNSTVVRPGASVLCLAARLGTECRAFLDLGCFAVGVDLNPGSANRYVVHGDFHDLQFPDNCVDIAFTNSLDHAYDIASVVREVRRVLKKDGWFIAEVVRGWKDEGGRGPGEYESLWWESNEDVFGLIVREGFSLFSRKEFEYPWRGDAAIFSPVGKG
ncbi:MAG TPA: class I SAM-dependent methyltransferase [Nitrospiraceae bacterium]|nr:class I SAM-dependent methyltransferase [Nitrospiraceae bacterium]